MVTKEIQRMLIQQDIQGWENGRFQTEMRMRVNKRIGNEAANEPLMEDLVKAEGALAELSAMLKELNDGDTKPTG